LKKNEKILHLFSNIFDSIETYAFMNSTKKERNEKYPKLHIEKELEIQQETYETLIRKLESDLRNQLKVRFFLTKLNKIIFR
jgi:hypothetical protein